MRFKRKPKKLRKPELSEDQILEWADAHRRLIGGWPTARGRPHLVHGAPAENWLAIDSALRAGLRGLQGGSSLARLLAARRGVRNPMAPSRLTVAQILKWCDEFHRRTGEWPRVGMQSRRIIPSSNGETWVAVNGALSHARRGLPGSSSLSKVLAQYRGVRNVGDLRSLTIRQVLQWADEYQSETGRWPTDQCRPQEIPGSGGETWFLVITAMRKGNRGFRRGSSLAEMLAKHRGVRNIKALPHLSVKQILEWADAFHASTGKWPTRECSPQEIPQTDGEQWCNVHQAFRKGLRGLPGGSSLAELLIEHRGVRNSNLLPPLTLKQVLKWLDAFYAKTGIWPTVRCSPQLIEGTQDERWRNVDNALRYGLRALPGGSSIARLLAEHREVPIARHR